MNIQNSRNSTKPKRKSTKRDDAASIVGDDLAELLEEYGGVKSNALIEMSEADSNRSDRGNRSNHSPVQAFLYPKGLSVRVAVAKSLHTQPREATEATEAPRPKSIRRVVRDTVGLRQYDKRRALASHFAGILQKAVFGNSEAEKINPHSVKNVVRGVIGLKPVSGQPTKPISVREAVRLSMQ